MDTISLFDKLKQNPRPVIVDFWAPWCQPCRVTKPILEVLAKEYDGKVDFWTINADENPEIMRTLSIYAIPTLLAFRNGEQVSRVTGARNAAGYREIFEALANGITPAIPSMGWGERLIRFGAGVAVAAIGAGTGMNWFLLIIGGVLMFSAVYDRCPIWKAITGWFRSLNKAS